MNRIQQFLMSQVSAGKTYVLVGIKQKFHARELEKAGLVRVERHYEWWCLRGFLVMHSIA